MYYKLYVISRNELEWANAIINLRNYREFPNANRNTKTFLKKSPLECIGRVLGKLPWSLISLFESPGRMHLFLREINCCLSKTIVLLFIVLPCIFYSFTLWISIALIILSLCIMSIWTTINIDIIFHYARIWRKPQKIRFCERCLPNAPCHFTVLTTMKPQATCILLCLPSTNGARMHSWPMDMEAAGCAAMTNRQEMEFAWRMVFLPFLVIGKVQC